MTRSTLKLLAFSSAVALGFALTTDAQAQPVTVNATLITSSAISTTDVSDMDFGEWLVQIGPTDNTADDVTITLTNDGTVAASAGNVTDSTVVQITAPATEGVVNVQTPAPATLTMTRSATSDFADTAMSLTNVSYRTATDGNNALDADNDTGTVTTTVAATDEAVTFGGVVNFTDTPADGTHTANFDVTFSY